MTPETKSFYSELTNKVKYLYQALDQCNDIIKKLETENNFLKQTCSHIKDMEGCESTKKNQDEAVDKSIQ